MMNIVTKVALMGVGTYCDYILVDSVKKLLGAKKRGKRLYYTYQKGYKNGYRDGCKKEIDVVKVELV